MNYTPKRLIIAPLLIMGTLIIGYSVVLAWQNPTAPPPGGNLPAPLNVSGTTQTKSGGLNILGSVGIAPPFWLSFH